MAFLCGVRAPATRSAERKLFAETQRRCDRLIADLQVTAPFHMENFIESVGETLDRPIIPLPMAMPAGGPTGLLLQTATANYIVFRRNTSRVHQESIVLHELAHLLCGHIGAQGMDRTRSKLLFPYLDPDMVISMLGRTTYSDGQEREAELFGSFLRTKLGTWSPQSVWVMPDDIAPVIDRIERVLGSRNQGDR